MSKATEAFAAIKASSEPMINAEDVAPVLGVNAQSIRLQAKENPKMLDFRVSQIGGKTVIPRMAFIAWVEGGGV